MNLISKITICFLTISLIFACKKEESFSKIPEIEVREFYMTSDTSAMWIIGFKDGDGDIGVDDNPSIPPNFPTTIYVIENGVVAYDTAGQGFRIPPIEGVNTENGVSGEIQLNFTGLDLFKIEGIDTLYYEGYLIDREGNQSNKVITPIIGIR